MCLVIKYVLDGRLICTGDLTSRLIMTRPDLFGQSYNPPWSALRDSSPPGPNPRGVSATGIERNIHGLIIILDRIPPRCHAVPAVGCLALTSVSFRETGILLPNNQRQHRTSHAPKDVLTLRKCANYSVPCQMLLRAFSEWIQSPPPTMCIIQL